MEQEICSHYSVQTDKSTQSDSWKPYWIPHQATQFQKRRRGASGFHAAGKMDKMTMQKYARLCLPPVAPLQPEKIREIREKVHVSQAVFVAMLNTSLSAEQKWEVGQKLPTATVLITRTSPTIRPKSRTLSNLKRRL